MALEIFAPEMLNAQMSFLHFLSILMQLILTPSVNRVTKWLTKGAYLRLATTHIGINVVDTYKLDMGSSISPRKQLRKK
jgi:hypothetical protein